MESFSTPRVLVAPDIKLLIVIVMRSAAASGATNRSKLHAAIAAQQVLEISKLKPKAFVERSKRPTKCEAGRVQQQFCKTGGRLGDVIPVSSLCNCTNVMI